MLLYVTPVIFGSWFWKGKYLHNGCSVLVVMKGWGCPPDSCSDQLVLGGTYSSHWQLAAELDCVLRGLRGVDECLSLPALPLRVGLRADLLMCLKCCVSLGTERWKKIPEFWRWQRSSVSWETRREKSWIITGHKFKTYGGFLQIFWGNDNLLMFNQAVFIYVCFLAGCPCCKIARTRP